MNANKIAALITMATEIADALESGAPQTDTVQASLPRFAAMVEPHDVALAQRILAFA